ncbi:MAG: NAD(P)/FAD-dependent oxidoreductase [Candidatus Harrisonbacteria bacterium]|nr:NAD(P)/FAD-dependent oxidoreductase [Candidatus Harrisonbacteria bacterium]
MIKNTAKKYDLIAIGTGSASGAPTAQAKKAGKSVAVIDSRPFGGTCALRGCHPKKILVSAAEAVDAIRRMKGNGLSAAKHGIDWPALMRFKRIDTDATPKKTEEGYAKKGIDMYHGHARFEGPNTIVVDGNVLEAERIVIATGAEPSRLPIEGFEHLTISDNFLELKELPKRIIFIGGGYISFEFSHVAALAGAKVTILHRGERPLEQFEPELTDILLKRSRALGIGIELEISVTKIEKIGQGVRVNGERNGKTYTFDADIAVHGAGRIPAISDLNLEAAGIEYDKRGVKVNEFLQSVSNPSVYAGGDAVAYLAAPLTPRAGYDGTIIAKNILEGNREKPDYTALASVVFTVPPLSSVGMGEDEAKKNGLKYRLNYADTSQWFSARLRNEAYSGHKVIIEEGSGKVLGAHLFGPHSDELINVFAVAIRFGISADDLKRVLYAFPTRGSDVPYML